MRRIVTAAALACTIAVLCATPAFAHGAYEHGDLVIVTGLAIEPAYVGQPNAVQLQIERGGRAVTDLRQGDLSVEVGFSGQRTTLRLEPQFEVGEWGVPGDYRAAFIPTQPGAYTFHITGTVDREKVNYSLTSGPKSFNEVEDPAGAMFPPVDAPSTSELAARIEQEGTRTTDAVDSATSAANTARTLGVVGVVLALAAIAVSIVTIARSRASANA
jgi:hypothetical protein